MKVCITCKKEKDESCFYKNRTTPDGYQYICKNCQKTYAHNHKDEKNDYNKRRRLENPAKFHKYQKDSYDRIKEKFIKGVFSEDDIYQCTRCKRYLPANRFAPNRG